MTMTMTTTKPSAIYVLVSCLAVVSSQTFVGFTDVAPMPLGRSDMTATVVPDPTTPDDGDKTRVYIAGGCSTGNTCPPDSFCSCMALTNKTHYFIPAQNRWVTTSADAPRERYRHAAATVNGTVYLFGGRTLDDTIITAVDAYDVAGNQWSTPCQWPAAVSDHTAFIDGNRIFLTAGYNAEYSPIANLTEFNPLMCSFTARTPMPSARGDATSVTVGGRHFVVGGYSTDFCHPDAVIESYNATANAWMVHSNLTIGRGDAGVGTIDGKVFVIGGETNFDVACSRSAPIDDVESLAPGTTGRFTGSWSVEEPVPSNRFRFVGATVGGSIYLFGGQGDFIANMDGVNGGFPVHNDVMRYAPNTFSDFEVTTLLNVHSTNLSIIESQVVVLQGTVASQNAMIAALRTQLTNLTAVLGSINPACISSSDRSRRSTGCPAAGSAGGSSTSTSINSAVAIGVSVAVFVTIVAVVAGFVWWRPRAVSIHKLTVPDPIENPIFVTSSAQVW